ncbi:type VI secretion system baseplate subunit TssF [Paraburkholderia sp. J67]|uniref:type VI secretion system baseplate subunit TssF n=1 Tax=Paraburkholderia sp. J67 TaxID=2805435 RepID=UPI002ABDDFC6|nr:type VI secretion system baseplate subunit TssF [Paraburkholderia sp. J67]
MDELLHYYERELVHLHSGAGEFAGRYPKIASRFGLGARGESDDLHVGRLFETFALLAARASHKVDDDYPEFTHALIESLYPHYLRAFPSCSIAHFALDQSRAAQMSSTIVVPRGTQLFSQPVQGSKVFFRTTSALRLSPLTLSSARFRATPDIPDLTLAPDHASSQISLTFSLQSRHASVADLQMTSVRLYAHGEPQFTAALRDALTMHALRAYIEPGNSRRWIPLEANPFSQAGMTRDDALIPYSEDTELPFLWLTELFAFPKKFNFIDLDLSHAAGSGGREFTVHLVLENIPADSPVAQILQSLDTSHLLLGCVPVVNLFEASGKAVAPANTAEAGTRATLAVDQHSRHACEIYAIDSVTQIDETPHGERVIHFDPLYTPAPTRQHARGSLYWRLDGNGAFDDDCALNFVNDRLERVAPPDPLRCSLTCTSRNLAPLTPHGLNGGDLLMEGGSLARRISLLHAPSRPRRFRHAHGDLWRLISQLSMNPNSLARGIAPLRELLRLHEMEDSFESARLTDSVVGLDMTVATAWLATPPPAGLARGLEFRLHVDQERLSGTGVHLFSTIIASLLPLYAPMHRFTQLVVLSTRDNRTLIKFPPRAGAAFLI